MGTLSGLPVRSGLKANPPQELKCIVSLPGTGQSTHSTISHHKSIPGSLGMTQSKLFPHLKTPCQSMAQADVGVESHWPHQT